eukprot:XP_001707212.1 Hypothetical protein GL50803_101599 [Giardia lamblia ATCC 50803]
MKQYAIYQKCANYIGTDVILQYLEKRTKEIGIKVKVHIPQFLTNGSREGFSGNNRGGCKPHKMLLVNGR